MTDRAFGPDSRVNLSGHFKGQDAPTGGPSDFYTALPIGGRLVHFFHQWELTSTDTWVLQTIQFGLSLEFLASPPDRFITCSISRDPLQQGLMQEAIKHLLEIQAIEPVPPDHKGGGFYSILFVVPKASGVWRAILDLKGLNYYITYKKFKMQSLRSILGGIRQGDFLASIDLTEAYLHIPIHPAHRRFFRFCYRGRHFQYKALPFGLSSAPRVFKILDVLATQLRKVPIRIQCYRDDILIQASSFQAAQADLKLIIQVLQQHGFSVSFQKSQMVPSSRLLHLGAVIDTTNCMVYLSQERLVSIRDQVYRDRTIPLVLLSQLLGKMVSCIAIGPWTRLHLRDLQWFLLPFQQVNASASNRQVRVPVHILRSLRWWFSQAVTKGSSFKELDRITITTDTSLFGWGAHLQSQFVQGCWSRADLRHNINWLELRAIHLALHQFRHWIRGFHVLILTDNVASKAHVDCQGGTRSRSLMSEARLLGSWAESNLASLRAEHISGVENHQADFSSRSTVDPSEWGLHPDLFSEISHRFGHPILNLFASSTNAQLPRY
ncbi:kelch-like protein 14 isoform X2 [Crotalus tigris]|uniref:kelch-like protein 14 isoform X2 n=1 Tax=Crotalus tigris TaxID=88082 RepID=UPI00192F8C05|nr:kelch-like protein 14 isoform X2 [Crotalus tigris]XP_039189597.1 kelch-like protein 14 isoform X2 [Crotalus tigris]